MAHLDQDSVELLTRRITDQVTTGVRASLFKLYAIVGTAAIAAAGYSAWDIYKQEVTTATEATKADIRNEMKELTRSADQQITDIAVRAKVADAAADRSLKTLDAIDELIRDARPKLLLIEQTQGRLDQAEQNIADITTKIERAKATIDNLPELSQQVIDIAKHLANIDEVLSKATSSEIVAGEHTDVPTGTGPTSIITATEAIQRNVASAEQKAVVFFQYSGMPPETADQIVSAIKAGGFLAPGKEHVAMSTAGERSIRYYYSSDEPAAETLRTVAQKALANLSTDGSQIRLIDLTDWPNRKPAANTLELWIGFPAPSSAN